MSVKERDSGVVEGHSRALEAVAVSENTFIFIRPTEYDSTILIKAGYATKSMDVHHKSSNWGPMAGFVPCDPAFNKKCDGKPNPDEHEHKHGGAYPIQLVLRDSLLTGHEKIEWVTKFTLTAAPSGGDKKAVPWMVKRQTGTGAVGSLKSKFEALGASGHIAQHKFCTAKPAETGNKSTLFCLIEKAGEWLVYWVKWDGDNGILNPLRVFAYSQNGRLNPVTGDYDLWMVAPHMRHLDAHAVTRLETDEHGSSAASGYTMGLIGKMNAGCGRSDNPVFNHGAESQNYGFTQALDWNLAMYTPGGASRMVRMNQMPGILSDLHQAGYLVVWNKRYGEDDPALMGAKDKRGGEKLSEIRSLMNDLNRELAEIARSAGSAPAPTPGSMSQLMKTEISTMAKKFEQSRNLGLEQGRIYRFNKKLLEFLDSHTGAFRVLTPSDFGGSFRMVQGDMRKMHAQLQQVMVGAMTGGGQSDEKKLKEWLDAHRSEIEGLKRYWT